MDYKECVLIFIFLYLKNVKIKMSMSIIPYSKSYLMRGKSYSYEYDKEKHYLFVKETLNNLNQEKILYETPFLKVYKSLHQQQGTDKFYLVLECDVEDEDDVNRENYNLRYLLDKMYGRVQEEIKKNFKEIFPNTRGLIDKWVFDTCIKRPFAGSRGQLVKILIPDDNDLLWSKIESLIPEQKIRCTFQYRGLQKIKGGQLLEEYVLQDFITESDWEAEQTKKLMSPYHTKFDVEIVNEVSETKESYEENQEEEYIQEEENVVNENKEENLVEVIQDNQNIDDNIEVISIKEEVVEDNNNQEKMNIEFMPESKEKSKKKSKDKEKNILKKKSKDKSKDKKLKRSLKSKKQEERSSSESESENDNLSDNEDFHKMPSEYKNIFRKMLKEKN